MLITFSWQSEMGRNKSGLIQCAECIGLLDFVARVFHLKLQELLKDLQNNCFGPCLDGIRLGSSTKREVFRIHTSFLA